MADTTELRFQLPPEEVSVLDGYCQGTGQDRTKVLRRILKEWSDAKLHEATLILRVAGRNPASPEPGGGAYGR
jgi:hypothetical protein